MTFDEIVAYEIYKKEEMSNMEKIRYQRQVCSVIISGKLFDRLELEPWELQLAHNVQRRMTPAPEKIVKKLEKIEERRWVK